MSRKMKKVEVETRMSGAEIWRAENGFRIEFISQDQDEDGDWGWSNRTNYVAKNLDEAFSVVRKLSEGDEVTA